jgi:hypothetical protein
MIKGTLLVDGSISDFHISKVLAEITVIWVPLIAVAHIFM